MVTFNKNYQKQDLIQKVCHLEKSLSEKLERLEEKLSNGQETFNFFNNGLKAHKEECIEEIQYSINNEKFGQLHEKFRNDKELRCPHRKILDFLLGQYDYTINQFNEINFSKLVKEAKVGKNLAHTYFSLLEEKGYIEKRDDGYRVFFRIKTISPKGYQDNSS